MKNRFLLAGLLVPLLANAAWLDANGKPIPDKENMRSAGGFGVQLVLTPDRNEFLRGWNAAKGTPNLRVADSVRIGSSVTAMLIFHGCKPNSAKVCDVVTEFSLEGPDGARTPGGGGPVWSGAPPQPRQLHLGQTNMTVGFDDKDPVGNYKVIANVRDKVSGRTLRLVARLKVTK